MKLENQKEKVKEDIKIEIKEAEKKIYSLKNHIKVLKSLLK